MHEKLEKRSRKKRLISELCTPSGGQTPLRSQVNCNVFYGPWCIQRRDGLPESEQSAVEQRVYSHLDVFYELQSRLNSLSVIDICQHVAVALCRVPPRTSIYWLYIKAHISTVAVLLRRRCVIDRILQYSRNSNIHHQNSDAAFKEALS